MEYQDVYSKDILWEDGVENGCYYIHSKVLYYAFKNN